MLTRCWCFVLVAAAIALPCTARAQLAGTPFEGELRRHAYVALRRSPWRALGYELLLPGAGSAYDGVYVASGITLALSLAGAGMWIAGARRDRPALLWSGVATFAAGRAHGLISAPVSAALLNAAFRRQLGLTLPY